MLKLKSQYEVSDMIMFADTPDIKAPAKMLLLALSGFGDRNGGNIYPSHKTLAKMSCMSRQSVVKNLAILEDKGYISVKRCVNDDGGKTTNEYVLNLAKITDCKNVKHKNNVVNLSDIRH